MFSYNLYEQKMLTNKRQKKLQTKKEKHAKMCNFILLSMVVRAKLWISEKLMVIHGKCIVHLCENFIPTNFLLENIIATNFLLTNNIFTKVSSYKNFICITFLRVKKLSCSVFVVIKSIHQCAQLTALTNIHRSLVPFMGAQKDMTWASNLIHITPS